jgi:hypothetical protein
MSHRLSFEFGMAILIGVIVVILQHREKPLPIRVLIAGCSGGIAYLGSDELQIGFVGPNLTAVLLAAFSYAVIDIGFGLLKDRELIGRVVDKLTGTKRK